MKLLILYLPEDSAIALDLQRRFSSIGIESVLNEYKSVWDQDLLYAIEEATHLFLLLRSSCLERKTSAFVLGYALGKKVPLLVYQLEPVTFPDIPGPIYRSHDPEGILSYFEGEKKIWTENRKRQVAREKIISLGLGVSEESLVSVVKEGEIVPLRLYMEAGFSPDTLDKKGVPLLCHGVRHNHRMIVAYLLEQGADIDKVSQDRGNTALMDAAADRNEEILELLISQGADLDIQSKNGQTALVLAVGQKAIEVSRILLEGGADFSLTDALGMSARKYAELFALTELLDLMKLQEGHLTEKKEESPKKNHSKKQGAEKNSSGVAHGGVAHG